MKVKELIEELQKYDRELEVHIFKQPIRKTKVVTFNIKGVGVSKIKDTNTITAVNISF